MNVRRGLFHALFRVGQPAVNRHYDYYRKTQWLPRQELEALQFERTQRVLQHAYDRFPFYRAKFDAAGVNRPKGERVYFPAEKGGGGGGGGVRPRGAWDGEHFIGEKPTRGWRKR